MLENLLSPEDCSKCPDKCCKFADPSHMPILTENELNNIDRKGIEYIQKGNLFQIKSSVKNSDGKTVCPFLIENKGCELKHHPFECEIWPFYVMRFTDKIVIAVSPNCPAINAKSFYEIQKTVNDGLSDCIIGMIKEYPGLIEDYYDDAIIIKIIGEERIVEGKRRFLQKE